MAKAPAKPPKSNRKPSLALPKASRGTSGKATTAGKVTGKKTAAGKVAGKQPAGGKVAGAKSGGRTAGTKRTGKKARSAPRAAASAKVPKDLVVKGEDGATMRHVEQRFGRFANKNTFWRHTQNGTMAEFDAAFDAAVVRLRAGLGASHPLVIAGRDVTLAKTFDTVSPADTGLRIGTWAAGTPVHARDAIAAAHAGFAAWSSKPWTERVAVIEKAGALFTEHFYDLCAVMCLEAGKSRYEASIDVDEAIDFLRFYALNVREMRGFDMEMGHPVPTEDCFSVRRAWGVFAVICPFNFPVAITTGMTAAALLMGNTVVLKPSGKGCLSGWWVFTLLRKAGVPAGALHFLTGADHGVSTELLESHDVDGLLLTGSKRVGFRAMEQAAKGPKPKPIIAEMGGKNAIVISDKADLDKAVQGVFREEFFMPFCAIAEVDSFEAGIREANMVEYGLTAGCFSEDKAEVQRFFDTVEAGVCYANRAAGGCTAAVVNGQSFVGWKNSGTTGHGAGGRYYLLQFTREQSRTVAHG